MINREKIIVMSKLAVLDKNHIQKDLRVTRYYPEDYVYVNNFKTRASVFCITALAIVAYIFSTLEKEIILPKSGSELFFYYILPYGSVLAAVLVIYTIISTHAYRKRYKEAHQRVTTYRKLLKELDRIDAETLETGGKSNGKRTTTHY